MSCDITPSLSNPLSNSNINLNSEGKIVSNPLVLCHLISSHSLRNPLSSSSGNHYKVIVNHGMGFKECVHDMLT